ncbi:hypothetical protein HORIV_10220 [Vreelandella olivaria]|uniref:DSBA-like thioredoxin domain-containing protein n=1 Tax=Vreelandella olivaria TaxID=390919 RepID=A0ABN5WVS1_9GAMM|nr:hypothetical protein HORIV_10220 [Halomonas olivaria]
MQKVRIDLVSDVACPWCAIGYRRLEQALETLNGEIDVELVWQPFELNPDMPPEGEPILEHLCRKYGKDAASMAQSQREDYGGGRGAWAKFPRCPGTPGEQYLRCPSRACVGRNAKPGNAPAVGPV